jgi:hypothetical protein
MGTSQTPAEVTPEVVPAPTVPPEARELAEVVTDLVQKTSELVLACEEIGEEMVRQFPVLKELKDICLDTARTMRRFLRLSRRRPR